MQTMHSLLDPALALAADVLDDIEKVRIANENRLRQLTRSEADSDGIERGFGLDPDHPDVMRLGEIIFRLEALEKDATKELERKLRKHPLGPWVKTQKGMGDKQVARLLAAIGDPYVNGQKQAPRTVSALWAYCGYHTLPSTGQDSMDTPERDAVAGEQLPEGQRTADAHGTHPLGNNAPGSHVAARRRKGVRANWSSNAKMRAFLIAESCTKQIGKECKEIRIDNEEDARAHVEDCNCSPYRVAYDKRREHTAKTNPDWPKGHSHNDGLRIAAKVILKELWRAARAWHLEQDPALKAEYERQLAASAEAALAS